MKFLSIKWIVVSLIVIGCVVLIVRVKIVSKPVCKDRAEYIHVKLGEHVFSVPWKSAGLYLKYGDQTIDSYKEYCKIGDPPIEVTQFSFSALIDKRFDWVSKKYKVDEIFEKYHRGFALRVFTENSNIINKGDSFVQFIKPEFEKAGVKLEKLPKKDDFYFWKGAWYDAYISTAKDFLTPSGNPMVFMCTPECRTEIVWKDDVTFSFQYLSELHVPPLLFKEFYYDFLSYMESLEVKNQETNNKNTGTQP